MIKFPTRSRPKQFFEVLDKYYYYLSGKHNVCFVISCDTDDLSMNNPQSIQKLESYDNLFYYFGDNKTKIEACNADIDKHMDFEILLLASDDMIPHTKGYDNIIIEKMKIKFPNLDGILHFNDGHIKNRISTYPILGKKYYQRFGYIYHPSYKSLYSDQEYTIVSRILRKRYYNRKILFTHKHYLHREAEKDPLYTRNEKFDNLDYNTFIQRRRKHFDL